MNRLQNTENLQQKYIHNPPKGTTSNEIRTMSDDKLLDMDDFLNQEGYDFCEAGAEIFYIF